MSQPPAPEELERLVALIREATGNIVPPARYDFLVEIAQRRAHVRGLPGFAEYVRALAAEALDKEWDSLIPLLTIKESYFFRAPQQFEAIRREVLPRLLRARAASRHLRIWSAACARGEEPGTLAMILAGESSLVGWDWTIHATDLDEEALSGARLGLYGERAVSQVPPYLLERYFNRRGKLFELSAELRSKIRYERLNLAHPPYTLPSVELDLVLLRNVLIYFRRPLQRWVMSQVAQRLARKGYLFLGASETLWQIQDELEPVDLGACFCYRHRRARPAAPATNLADAAPAPPPTPLREKPAAARTTRTAAPPPPAAPADSPRPAPLVDVPPIPELAGAHERLVAAARNLAENRVDEAGRAIEQALAADPSEPAAHALEGFLHDLRNRTDEVVTAYRAALYLDPSLFQVRLLLADCLLRLGHRERAEHQFREVLTTLDGGRERPLDLFEELPLPDPERARRRCRQVLRGAG
jgi:chemotaxis protein methyltransferase CheR